MTLPSTRWIVFSCIAITVVLVAYSFGLAGSDAISSPHGQASSALAEATSQNTPDTAASAAVALADKARFQWAMNCQGCHGPNGEGHPDRDVPTMVDVAAFQKIPDGREFLVRVPGVSRSPLNDEDLTYLLNWMVRTMGTSLRIDKRLEFSQEEVTALRQRPLVDELKQVRRNLIDKVK